MRHGFPWLPLLFLIAPLVAVVIVGFQTGAFFRDYAAGDRLIWQVHGGWFVDNLAFIAIMVLGSAFFGLRGLWRHWRQGQTDERFEEEGYLTYADLHSITANSSRGIDAVVSLPGGPHVTLKGLPDEALQGREIGDQLPVYTLPDNSAGGVSKALAWAGYIDSPEEHTLPLHAMTPDDPAAPTEQQRTSAAAWMTDIIRHSVRNKAVEETFSHPKEDGSATVKPSDSAFVTSKGAIHTKFARVSFLDVFLMVFLPVHGGVFFNIGLVRGFQSDTPLMVGGLFSLIGVVELGILALLVFRIVRKIRRRAHLKKAGVEKEAFYVGSVGTKVRINRVKQRALILEIDNQRYRHGIFSPRKTATLSSGQRLRVLQDPTDPRLIYLPTL